VQEAGSGSLLPPLPFLETNGLPANSFGGIGAGIPEEGLLPRAVFPHHPGAFGIPVGVVALF